MVVPHGPNTGRGTHGLSRPDDLEVLHFFGLRSGIKHSVIASLRGIVRNTLRTAGNTATELHALYNLLRYNHRFDRSLAHNSDHTIALNKGGMGDPLRWNSQLPRHAPEITAKSVVSR